jgi:hypothetical protein
MRRGTTLALLTAGLTLGLGLAGWPPNAALAQSDPREEAFRVWLQEAGHALLAAAGGAPVDPRWHGPDEASDLRSGGADPTIASLGPDVRLLATTVNVRWSTITAFPTVHLDLMPYAMSDGQLLWAANSVVEETPFSVVDPTYLSNGPPELAGGLERALEVMQTTCALPGFTAETAEVLPGPIRAEVTHPGLSLERTCREVAEAAGALWLPSLVFFAAILESEGRTAAIFAPLHLEDGRAWLGPPQVMPF